MRSCMFIGAGMVVDWEQETGLLMTSGDVRVIRIWDTDREMKVQVLYSVHLSICLSVCMPDFLKKVTINKTESWCIEKLLAQE